VQVFLLASLFGLIAGCSEEIETSYGRRQGPTASASINGTAVLGSMFEQAGHSVFSWRTLSPKLHERADCIVWFPDDFQPPSEDVRKWLHSWLSAESGRTLIYVGRDFDAEGWYWAKVEPDAYRATEASDAPSGRLAEARRQLTQVRQRKNAADRVFRQARGNIPESEDCQWFTVDGTYQPRKVQTLDGNARWLQGIVPEKVEMELNGRISAPFWADVLLESEGDVLVSREWNDGSQLIVVANGSFLLNVSLVNHEHRKLAGKLIDEVGPPSKTVVFLESDADGPPISDEDPSATAPTPWDVVTVAPACWIFLHFVVVGVVFCFSRWPIFGLARELPPDSPSDFGKHIQALAELLQRCGDRAYAMTRLLHYRQTTKSNE